MAPLLAFRSRFRLTSQERALYGRLIALAVKAISYAQEHALALSTMQDDTGRRGSPRSTDGR